VKGPPASRAYDAAGQPTRAAEGFAQSKGMSVSDLQTRVMDGGVYLVALVKEVCRPAHEVLKEALPGLIEGIRFEKSMRWNHTNVAFSRPLRWLLALHDGAEIPFEFAGLTAGRVTHGLRFHDPNSQQVHSLADYRTYLAGQGILLDPRTRREAIRSQVIRLSAEVGGVENIDEGLLDEVNQLVEAPTALRGKFDPAHLELPADVLISVMKKHQRYFPVIDPQGKLLPYFIAVRNGDTIGLDVVTDGNEQVIKARFSDAQFFIKEDLKHKLEDLLVRLGTLTFQYKLGSMLDKSQRITALVEPLTEELGLTAEEKATALRAAVLCKADLVSHMVVEMTSLQGIMGRYYALHSGETPEVAQAISEHYLPRYNGDSLPSSKAGLVVGIADRLDSLVGLFAAGLAPTGARDPFAQRRAAIGLVQLLSAFNIDFDLNRWMKIAAEKIPIEASDKELQACAEFIAGRQRSNLIEQGYRYDVVDAVLAEQQNNPAGALRAVKELSEWVAREDWKIILPAYARCVRITRDQTETYEVDPRLFEEKSEKVLYAALMRVEGSLSKSGSVNEILTAFIPMIPAVNAFFDSVLVMTEDVRVRNNRLALLQRIAALTKGAADLSRLEGF